MSVASRVTARRPRAIGPPGMLAWTALPLRDQRLITWLWAGDVVNAELAAVLAYGNLRVAQRRLARLVEYGILRGFWAANRQRPRGRYAYALTKAARKDVEYLLWEHNPPEPVTGQVQAPSPVIHQLATHDLLAAFLRASPLTDEIGLAGWVPEHAAALRYDGALRPDAIAVVRRGEVGTLLIIERDLGSERHEILLDKLRRYNFIRGHPAGSNLGFILDSRRRAGALLVSLRAAARRNAGSSGSSGIPCWVAVGTDLLDDPFGTPWRSPDGREASVLTMPTIALPGPLPILSVPPLLDDAAEGAFDDRVLSAAGWRGR
jgi:hypothetical protein